MTRATQLHLIRTRRTVILTVKSAILLLYWQGKAALIPSAAVCIALFGLHVAGNAARSDMPWLYLVALVCVIVGLGMFPKNRRV